jgi:hypothetical protein
VLPALQLLGRNAEGLGLLGYRIGNFQRLPAELQHLGDAEGSDHAFAERSQFPDNAVGSAVGSFEPRRVDVETEGSDQLA